MIENTNGGGGHDLAPPSLSMAIPSFQRHDVLVSTIELALDLRPAPAELIVVDQTPDHPPDVSDRLAELERSGRIRWMRSATPSITAAMNRALLTARGEIVIFVDDDVVPVSDLVARHLAPFADPGVTVVAGQVLQPGEAPESLSGEQFAFRSAVAQPVDEVIGCNFSVRREAAIAAGGFDENFVQVAYRFEREFCDRMREHGGSIHFEPLASLRHLRSPQGGTRAYGEHLRTARPGHAVGEYYYLLGAHRRRLRWRELARRPWAAIATRHHLRRPWWIPATLAAELLGFVWALSLRCRGPRLLDTGIAHAQPATQTPARKEPEGAR